MFQSKLVQQFQWETQEFGGEEDKKSDLGDAQNTDSRRPQTPITNTHVTTILRTLFDVRDNLNR